jgi:hypothetical protein
LGDYRLQDFVVNCAFVCLLLENGADVGAQPSMSTEMLLIGSVKRLIIWSSRRKLQVCVSEEECATDVDC